MLSEKEWKKEVNKKIKIIKIAKEDIFPKWINPCHGVQRIDVLSETLAKNNISKKKKMIVLEKNRNSLKNF